MDLNSKIESINERTLSIIIDKENYNSLQEIAKFHNTKVLNLVNIFVEEGIEKYLVKKSTDTYINLFSDESLDNDQKNSIDLFGREGVD